MISKKKLSALYAKYVLGELTVDELLTVAVFKEFSMKHDIEYMGYHFVPIGKIKKENETITIFMGGDEDVDEGYEFVDIPCDRKVKLNGDVVRVSGSHWFTNDEIEIEIKLDKFPFQIE